MISYKKQYKAFSLVEAMYAILILSLILILFAPLMTKMFNARHQDGRIFTYDESSATDNDPDCKETVTASGWGLDYTTRPKCSVYRFTVPKNVYRINLTLVAGGGGGGGASGMLYNKHEGEYITSSSFTNDFINGTNAAHKINDSDMRMVQFPNNIEIKDIREFAIKYITPAVERTRTLENSSGNAPKFVFYRAPSISQEGTKWQFEDLCKNEDGKWQPQKDDEEFSISNNNDTICQIYQGYLENPEGYKNLTVNDIGGLPSASFGYIDYIVPREHYNNLALSDFDGTDNHKIKITFDSTSPIKFTLNNNDVHNFEKGEVSYSFSNRNYKYTIDEETKDLPRQGVLNQRQGEANTLKYSDFNGIIYYNQTLENGNILTSDECINDIETLLKKVYTEGKNNLYNFGINLCSIRGTTSTQNKASKGGRLADGRYGYCGGGEDGYIYQTSYKGTTFYNPNINNIRKQCHAFSMTYLRPYSKGDNPSPAGGGGGGGGAVRILNFPVEPGSTYVVRVGSGGAGGTAGKDYTLDTVETKTQNMIPTHKSYNATELRKQLSYNSTTDNKLSAGNGRGGVSTSVYRLTPNGEELVFMVVGGKGGEAAKVELISSFSGFEENKTYTNINTASNGSEATVRYTAGNPGQSAYILLTGNGEPGVIDYNNLWFKDGGVQFDENVATAPEIEDSNNTNNAEFHFLNMDSEAADGYPKSAYQFSLRQAYLADKTLENAIHPYWYLQFEKKANPSAATYTCSSGDVLACSKRTNMYNSSITAVDVKIADQNISKAYDGLYYQTYLQDYEKGFVGGNGGFSGLGGKAGCGGLFMGNREALILSGSTLQETEVSAVKKLLSGKFIINIANNPQAYNVSDYYDNCNITTPNGQTAKFVEPNFRAQTFGQAGAGGGGGGYTIQEGPGAGGAGQDGYVMIDWRK